MEKTEQKEIIAELKGKIREFEHENGDIEQGVVFGLMWAMYMIEGGVEYANQRVALPKIEECDCKECGC